MNRTKLRLRTSAVAAALIATVITGLVTPTASSAAERGQVTGVTSFSIPPWFKDSFLEISEDAAEAGESGKHLLMFFHIAGCPYCDKTLKENFLSGPNAEFIRDNFDSIEINIKGNRDIAFDADTSMPEKELARAMNVLHTPAIVFADPSNKKVLRLDGYRDANAFRTALDYVQTAAYTSTSFSDYTREANSREETGYSLRAHPAFTTATDLQSLAQEPLALVFEDANCTGCDEVHDNLFARDDVSAALSTLRVVRLDSLSEEKIVGPDCSETTPKSLAESLGISWRPGVVLYDRGEVRATMNNRLFSWHFNGYLTWVSGRHYDTTPYVFDYMAALREKRLAAGEDVSYVDEPANSAN